MVKDHNERDIACTTAFVTLAGMRIYEKEGRKEMFI